MTARTFGCASAADVSIDTMRACASGLRSTAPCSIPGRLTSSTYVPWPRMKRGSSLRFMRPKPIGRSSMVAISDLLCGRGDGTRRRGLVLGRPAHRLDDVRVARAAADLPRDRLADLLVGRARIAVQQRPRGHDHAGGAEAALEAVRLHETLLHGVERAVALHVLDGADLVAARHRGEHGAGLHGLSVEVDDAGAAVGGVTAPVGTGQAERLAQEVHEQQPRLDLPRDLAAVDGHGHLHGVTPPRAARARLRAGARAWSAPR